MGDAQPIHKLFISYRRDDNPDFVARIRDRFITHYKEENVFRDIESIVPFDQFADAIQNNVKKCDVLIVIIGPKWVDLMKAKAAKSEEDYVRVEIELALQLGKFVAPICIKDAAIPSADQIPAALHLMLRANFDHVRDDRAFYDDVQRIISAIENELNKRNGISSPSSSSELPDDHPTKVVQKVIDQVNARPLPPDAPIWKKLLAVSRVNPGLLSLENREKIVQLDPLNADAYFARAEARLWHNHYDLKDENIVTALMADYTMAIRLNPMESSYIRVRGYYRHKIGDFAGAIHDYTESLHLLPEQWDTYERRAKARHMNGDFKGAIADYLSYIRLISKEYPKSKPNETYCDLAEAYFALEEYQNALDYFERVNGRDEKQKDAKQNHLDWGQRRELLGLAVTHFAIGEPDASRKYWNKLLIDGWFEKFSTNDHLIYFYSELFNHHDLSIDTDLVGKGIVHTGRESLVQMAEKMFKTFYGA